MMVHQFASKVFKSTNIILLFSLMSGCLSLILGPSAIETHPPISRDKAEVYLMRGFLDVFSTGMNTLAKRIKTELNIHATALSYLEESKLAAVLVRRYQSGQFKGPLVLIGHSFGADSQIAVARRLNEAGVPVDLLITLDNTRTQKIPPNVRVFYNINSGRSIISWIVPWGTPLQPQTQRTKMVEVNLIRDKISPRVCHFNIDKLPEIQTFVIDIIRENVLRKKDKLLKHMTKYQLSQIAGTVYEPQLKLIG